MSGIRQKYIQEIISQAERTKPLGQEDLLFLNSLTLGELANIADDNVRDLEETMSLEEMLNYQPRNVQKDLHAYFVSFYTKKGRKEQVFRGTDENDVKVKLWASFPDAYRISDIDEII